LTAASPPARGQRCRGECRAHPVRIDDDGAAFWHARRIDRARLDARAPAHTGCPLRADGASLTGFFRDSEIIELQLSQAGFERMVEFVRQTHELDAHGRAIVINSELPDGSRFYASPRTFDALENCNVWVARALEAADLPVRSETAITAGMLLRQVRRLHVAAPVASQQPP